MAHVSCESSHLDEPKLENLPQTCSETYFYGDSKSHQVDWLTTKVALLMDLSEGEAVAF